MHIYKCMLHHIFLFHTCIGSINHTHSTLSPTNEQHESHFQPPSQLETNNSFNTGHHNNCLLYLSYSTYIPVQAQYILTTIIPVAAQYIPATIHTSQCQPSIYQIQYIHPSNSPVYTSYNTYIPVAAQYIPTTIHSSQ